jgi:ribonuclease I
MILREKMPDGLQKKIADKYKVSHTRVRQIFEKGVFQPDFKEVSIEVIDTYLEEVITLCE